jgi:cobalt-zinc-cadmium efflux system outer membrane protein
MSAKVLLAAFPLCLLFVVGCTFPVRQQTDNLICERSNLSLDLSPPDPVKDGKDGKKEPTKEEGRNGADRGAIQQAGFLEQGEPKKDTTMLKRLLPVPQGIPGSNAPDIGIDPKLPRPEGIAKVIKEHFPPIPLVEKIKDFPPGPDGSPLTLTDLQKIAAANSPFLRQAASDIEAARGNAIQAGAYPNPTVGIQSAGVGISGGPSAGATVSQTIVVGGKLKEQQAAALEALEATKLAYRRAQTDLMWNVRTNYYGVLVAQESIRANRGLVELTDEVYRVMVDQLRGGEVAIYEPKQLRVFSDQARQALLTAHNSRLLAWKQLAAVLGVPHMPPTALAGSVNHPVPRIDYEKALAHVLTKHTDMLTTATAINQARHNLLFAQLTPYPDVTVSLGVVNDLTAPGPSRLVTQVGVSVPVPIWDRNKGGIIASQAALLRANEEPHRVQAALTSGFADAFRRYEENRVLMEMYQTSTLPSQVQAFRAVVKRHFGAGPGDPGAPAYNDLVSAEQNLVTIIGNYLPLLQAQWQAVCDVSNFLQTDQLYKVAEEVSSEPAVNFEKLLEFPCHHPCSPVVPAPTRESFRMLPAVQSVSNPAIQSVPMAATFAKPIVAAEQK